MKTAAQIAVAQKLRENAEQEAAKYIAIAAFFKEGELDEKVVVSKLETTTPPDHFRDVRKMVGHH